MAEEPDRARTQPIRTGLKNCHDVPDGGSRQLGFSAICVKWSAQWPNNFLGLIARLVQAIGQHHRIVLFQNLTKVSRGCEMMVHPTIGDCEDFALLKKIADRNDLGDLSMGMSADFESAIRLGATYVRVGSGVFGDRVYD